MTICLAALAAAVAAAGGGRPDAPTPDAWDAPTTRPGDPEGLFGASALDETALPVTPPAIVDEKVRKRFVPALPEGSTVFDRTARLARGPRRRWWTIDHPRAEELYLLPCELLETVEHFHLRDPEARFRLSGEVCVYRGRHYLLLRRALRIDSVPAAKPAAPTTAPAAAGPTTAPATRPAAVAKAAPATRPSATAPAEGASADEVASRLLGETIGRPVVPTRRPVERVEVVPSVVPAGEPLPAGPGRMVVNRLGRLLPGKGRWPLLAFRADNTLREPPMRVLPNGNLQRLESMSESGSAAGAVFHVSGEVHQYRGAQYLLIRNVIRKRSMDEF